MLNGMAALFTTHLDLTPFTRGEFAGSIAVAVVAILIAVYLAATGIAEAWVAGGTAKVASEIGRALKAAIAEVKAKPGKAVAAFRSAPSETARALERLRGWRNIDPQQIMRDLWERLGFARPKGRVLPVIRATDDEARLLAYIKHTMFEKVQAGQGTVKLADEVNLAHSTLPGDRTMVAPSRADRYMETFYSRLLKKEPKMEPARQVDWSEKSLGFRPGGRPHNAHSECRILEALRAEGALQKMGKRELVIISEPRPCPSCLAAAQEAAAK
jgi:hypothetical protein